MDKESKKELQKIDCNCNDCAYLNRSLSKRQNHVDFHFDMQKRHFNSKRMRLLKKGEWWLKKNEVEKAKLIFKEARGMRFVFDEGSCSLHYGMCTKFKKDVSFVTNTCQLETQDCFKPRN